MTQSIGNILKEERLRQGISLQEVSNQTLIRKTHLEAIEDDNFSMLSSKAQLWGFINIYSEFLKIDPNQFHLVNGSTVNKIEASPLAEASNDKDGPEIPDNNTQIALDEPEILEDQGESDLHSESHNKTESKTSQDVTKSQQIFEELGFLFQQRRNILNFSLSDVEEYIHIKEEYLEALEGGEHSTLPSPVQTQGMITNYSRFLNLDENTILLMFAEGLQEKRLEKSKQKLGKSKISTAATAATLSIRKLFTLDLLFGSTLIIGILIFLIWGASNMLSTGQLDDIQPTIPNIAEVLISTDQSPIDISETPDPNAIIVNTVDPEATPILVFTPLVSNSPIQVTIISRQSSWIRVISDGNLIYEGRIEAGNASTYNADTKLELVSGNASALQVFFKEEDLGSLGLLGQVVTLLFDKTGLIRPTVTPSPTTTNTPPISTTPTSGFIN